MLRRNTRERSDAHDFHYAPKPRRSIRALVVRARQYRWLSKVILIAYLVAIAIGWRFYSYNHPAAPYRAEPTEEEPNYTFVDPRNDDADVLFPAGQEQVLESFPYAADVSVLPNSPYIHVFETTDLRSTYTIYLETIASFLVESVNSGASLQPPQVPFHWQDWIDLNILNPLKREKPNCFRVGALGSTKRTAWDGCVEDKSKARDSLGFRFTAPALSHESEFRLSLRGKSYVHSSAANPQKLVFLSGDLAFVLKVAEKQRLVSSNLIRGYVSAKAAAQKISTQELERLPILPLVEMEAIANTLGNSVAKDKVYGPVSIPMEKFTYVEDEVLIAAGYAARTNGEKHFHDVLYERDGQNEQLGYDWRFFHKKLSTLQHRAALHHTIRAWLSFTHSIGLDTWLSDESLVGWSRNGIVLPWESVVHFELPAADLGRLAASFNHSLIVADPTEGTGNYLIDVQPYFLARARKNNGNASPEAPDARFIDTRTGVYIELSGLLTTDKAVTVPDQTDGAYQEDARDPAKRGNFLNSGMGHFYHKDMILPLRKTLFEGLLANVPKDAEAIVARKYPDLVLSTEFYDYVYKEHLRLWVPLNKCRYVPNEDIELYALGGSSFIGACHDANIWQEYNMTRLATAFKAKENDTADPMERRVALHDQSAPLYPDNWLGDRIKGLNRHYGYPLPVHANT
ncbi:hypothetical protein BABINDRAFT_160265 [Babjeviella inositovora NRRL Y-12698]|uniref:LicD/FKTN/FKRP nucleotidyltransferase domain-containing protein n=1 Tax=Babjeviella inositovora NRRL Y-12698 TaxID=984486 RepID=A0A1E3QWL3_9ASCO|nr:uncharacterized protein BABINDRAFT_160265 [Babjeviella inositovora NRRL Y-12698]ODQ82068.1 hypothetical protein BABINDRAFT_160265 [Babjeviella inositovora NRRL Y-12698]